MQITAITTLSLLAAICPPASAHRRPPPSKPYHRRSLQYQPPSPTYPPFDGSLPALNLVLPTLDGERHVALAQSAFELPGSSSLPSSRPSAVPTVFPSSVMARLVLPTALPSSAPLATVAAVASTISTSTPPAVSSGLAGVKDAVCGASGAQLIPSIAGGPNGSEAWLTCGLSMTDPKSGWTPPYVTVGQLKTIPLSKALTEPGTPFAACRPYEALFEKYGASTGIPPIFLAAIAMQESSCNAYAMGDEGWAYGLMQITVDKCGDAPNGNCLDPEYNIKTGAEYFASRLAANNGDVLRSLGTYNGWYPGMSYESANAIRSQCCQCVNNLDYMQQMLNWWVLGMDGSTAGTFRNLC